MWNYKLKVLSRDFKIEKKKMPVKTPDPGLSQPCIIDLLTQPAGGHVWAAARLQQNMGADILKFNCK